MIGYEVAAGYLDIGLNQSITCSKVPLHLSTFPTPKASPLPKPSPKASPVRKPRPTVKIHQKSLSISPVKFKELRPAKPRPVVSKLSPIPTQKLSKTYLIEGSYPDVSNTLDSKGWRRYNPAGRSHYDLKWTKTSRLPDNLLSKQLINHIDGVKHLSIKANLTRHLRRLSDWCQFYPETYVADPDYSPYEASSAYKYCYIESLLKEFVNGAAVPIYKVRVCLAVCEQKCEQLYSGKLFYISPMQWGAVSSNAPDSASLLEPLTREELQHQCAQTLQRIEQRDPQFHLRGSKNLWILKAGRLSRGRKIKLVDNCHSLMSTMHHDEYLVQKYMENPLLIHGYKFDIRQWVLLVSNPLRVYVYSLPYLRFSTQKFKLQDISNPYIHLTNNSIVKRDPEFIPENSMWNSCQFAEYLSREHQKDLEEINREVVTIVQRVIGAVQHLIGKRDNCFELLGFDIMIDADLKPWLIEVNSSPALDYSTSWC